MNEPEYIEVVGGPLDGSRMEWVPETKIGFVYRSDTQEYYYALKLSNPKRGEIQRRRFILEDRNNGERKGKGQKG